LTGLAALGTGALLAPEELWAQAPGGKPRRIDVHHHYSPPVWVRAAAAGLQRQKREPLNDIQVNWSQEQSLEAMDRGGFAAAAISIASPGVYLGDNAAAVRLARECNEYGAKLVADHPSRYGLFGVLPIPDIDGSLREIEYVLDTLKGVGFGQLTSYWDKWLGDPDFFPIFEELNRRKAVVYTHPTTGKCCEYLVRGVNRSTVEYAADTTRVIMSLLNNGAAKRFPEIRWIFSHGGGAMPFLLSRILGSGAQRLDVSPPPDSNLFHLRRFYYDTAAVANPISLSAVKKVVGASQVLLGTDQPFGGPDGMLEIVKGVHGSGVFTPEELREVDYANALRLFPALKT
jgi:predicted TIM-barrel fold metal-dependent hydrolase